MRMNMRFLAAVVLVAVLGGGCVKGVEPPAVTPLVEIAAGDFLFGSTDPCFNLTQTNVTCELNTPGLPKVYPTVLVTLPGYLIDQTEVTNYQYEYCVAMGGCSDLLATTLPTVADYYGNPSYRDYPLANATLQQAMEYCAFVGRRLPTEAEWERAAAGPATTEAQKRKYPFDDGAKDEQACKGGLDVAIKGCNSIDKPAPVGKSSDDYVIEPTRGQKIYDLAGNVAEFVQGFWVEAPTCKAPLPTDCTDCFTCKAADGACKSDCWSVQTCDCVNGKADCFKQCKGGMEEIPICIPYPVEAHDWAVLYHATGKNGLARGGAYTDLDSATCRARVTDRNSPSRHAAAMGFQNIFMGFRCAVDLSCQDGIDNNGDGLIDLADPKCRSGLPGGEN